MHDHRLKVAKTMARDAGQLILRAFGKGTRITKKGAIDLLTETDLASEELLTTAIDTDFPNDAIVAEEGSGHEGSNRYTWFVDPLDGTTNFAHGFPIFAVSIGVMCDDEMVVGVIYLPTTDELFSAGRGDGAFCNDRRLDVSVTRDLGEGLLATGFAYNRRERAVELLAKIKKALDVSQGIRRCGAASVDLCRVASGQLDGYWESDLQPWDWAAGTLIVEEAGGKISDFEGAEYRLGGRTLVASNSHIHQQLLTRITSG